MIDFHKLVATAVAPVKVRPAIAYIDTCTVKTNSETIEVADTNEIIASPGTGTGVICNPTLSTLSLFHLGRALTIGPWKINNLPSACDLIIFNDQELILAELTESNPRSVAGIPGTQNPGKMEKAKRQLKSTISFIDSVETDNVFHKRTAIFFFRFPTKANGIAAKSLNAFMMRPTLRTVTVFFDTECPGWEFRNHPYPFPYTITE